MSLRKIYRLAPKLEPAAAYHRDHIRGEPAAHDLGHCPKPSGRQYAWRVTAPGRRARTETRG